MSQLCHTDTAVLLLLKWCHSVRQTVRFTWYTRRNVPHPWATGCNSVAG